MTNEVRLERTIYYDIYGPGPLAQSIAGWLELQPDAVPHASPFPPALDTGNPSAADAIILVLHRADFASAMRQSMAERREGLRTLIHATFQHIDTWPVADPGERSARRLVIVSSAMVHGAWPERPIITDDSALTSTSVDDDGVVGDLVYAEELLAEELAARPHVPWSVVRPAAIVGGGADTIMTRHFEAPRILALKDVSRRWQFCHVDDVAKAVHLVTRGNLDGALVAGTPGTLSTLDIARKVHKRFVLLTGRAAFAAAARLNRSGIMQTPVSDLAFAVYPWTVSPIRLMEAGWQPNYDVEACLAEIVEAGSGHLTMAGQRIGKPLTAAALGAAGAAVAAVGTAALVRRSRRR